MRKESIWEAGRAEQQPSLRKRLNRQEESQRPVVVTDDCWRRATRSLFPVCRHDSFSTAASIVLRPSVTV